VVSFKDWGWGFWGLWMGGWVFGFENLICGLGAQSVREKIGKF
jgi:hypothetical protein